MRTVDREGVGQNVNQKKDSSKKILDPQKYKDDINVAKFENLLKGHFFSTHAFISPTSFHLLIKINPTS